MDIARCAALALGILLLLDPGAAVNGGNSFETGLCIDS